MSFQLCVTTKAILTDSKNRRKYKQKTETQINIRNWRKSLEKGCVTKLGLVLVFTSDWSNIQSQL